MHSTIGQERMTDLALMHVKFGMELNLDEIIIFLGQHPYCRIHKYVYSAKIYTGAIK